MWCTGDLSSSPPSFPFTKSFYGFITRWKHEINFMKRFNRHARLTMQSYLWNSLSIFAKEKFEKQKHIYLSLNIRLIYALFSHFSYFFHFIFFSLLISFFLIYKFLIKVQNYFNICFNRHHVKPSDQLCLLDHAVLPLSHQLHQYYHHGWSATWSPIKPAWASWHTSSIHKFVTGSS